VWGAGNILARHLDDCAPFWLTGWEAETKMKHSFVEIANSAAYKILSKRNGGYTAKVGDAVAIVPTVNPDAVTPHSEAFQAVIWHLLVTHPLLKSRQTKWEATR
jgi:hypothetical protein